MSRWRLAMLAGIGAALLAAPASAQADYCDGEDAQITAGNADGAELVQLCLVNVHRASAGLPALTMDPGLRTAARTHSRWMDDHDSLCHYPDPLSEPPVECDGSPDSRAAAAGYPHATGENIRWTDSAGFESRALFELLRGDAGLSSNMLFADYDTAGIGIVTGKHGVVVTQLFGVEPNGATDTAVSLLRRDGCPDAEASLRKAASKVKRAKRKLQRADTGAERQRAKSKLRRAKRKLGSARKDERAQCRLTSFVGSSLSRP